VHERTIGERRKRSPTSGDQARLGQAEAQLAGRQEMDVDVAAAEFGKPPTRIEIGASESCSRSEASSRARAGSNSEG